MAFGLREKVNKNLKKGGGSQKSSSDGGILMPLLLIALLCVGGYIAWQLMMLNNSLGGGSGLGLGFPSLTGDSGQAYEYAVDFIFDSNLSGRMAQRGRDGWQVVGSRRTQDSITGQLGYEFIFMRKAR